MPEIRISSRDVLIQSEDLEAAKSGLQAAAYVIEIEDPRVPKCYLRDPFGPVFNIAER